MCRWLRRQCRSHVPAEAALQAGLERPRLPALEGSRRNAAARATRPSDGVLALLAAGPVPPPTSGAGFVQYLSQSSSYICNQTGATREIPGARSPDHRVARLLIVF